ncbi:p-selectin glycoprotein ligand-1 [Anaeramoeba flamelloides]|uniref:P-selectin glycoprotein ligand-1 n=1 Tax=Anaeramoeba flamelloides TaxID=1746091 RepID=A0ABQ8Z625_9EUKA|nr:p-selectin glycoprotein ligand-1 [Anaeramoeba flamelloides]
MRSNTILNRDLENYNPSKNKKKNKVTKGTKRKLQCLSKRNQKEPKGTKRNQKEPKGTKRNQKEPKGTKRNQKEPKGTKRNQKEPKGTKRNQKEPKGTKVIKWKLQCFYKNHYDLFNNSALNLTQYTKSKDK